MDWHVLVRVGLKKIEIVLRTLLVVVCYLRVVVGVDIIYAWRPLYKDGELCAGGNYGTTGAAATGCAVRR